MGDTTPRACSAVIRLPESIADFGRRRFRLSRPVARRTLEAHSRSFLRGFNVAVASWRDPHERLAEVPDDERGFAYEGAAFHAALRDLAMPGRSTAVRRLLDGPGDRYVHLIHVGCGWALAPHLSLLPLAVPDTPLLRWLALDGAGFARTYFGGAAALRRCARSSVRDPRWTATVAGCGRALWFVESADPGGVRQEINAAPHAARGPLWSGIGLAAAYAGGVGWDELNTLVEAAGRSSDHLRQGVAFGVAARSRSGVVPAHTVAAATLLHADPGEVERWTDIAADGLGSEGDAHAYLSWRSRLRTLITDRGAAAAGAVR